MATSVTGIPAEASLGGRGIDNAELVVLPSHMPLLAPDAATCTSTVTSTTTGTLLGSSSQAVSGDIPTAFNAAGWAPWLDPADGCSGEGNGGPRSMFGGVGPSSSAGGISPPADRTAAFPTGIPAPPALPQLQPHYCSGPRRSATVWQNDGNHQAEGMARDGGGGENDYAVQCRPPERSVRCQHQLYQVNSRPVSSATTVASGAANSGSTYQKQFCFSPPITAVSPVGSSNQSGGVSGQRRVGALYNNSNNGGGSQQHNWHAKDHVMSVGNGSGLGAVCASGDVVPDRSAQDSNGITSTAAATNHSKHMNTGASKVGIAGRECREPSQTQPRPRRGGGHMSRGGMGRSSGRILREQHVKTKMCPYLGTPQGCFNADECLYAHSVEELRERPDLTKTKLCQNFAAGYCHEGPNCTYAHGVKELRSTPNYYKTDLCKYWAQGSCHSGDLCRHAHGPADLKGEVPHLQRGGSNGAVNSLVPSSATADALQSVSLHHVPLPTENETPPQGSVANIVLDIGIEEDIAIDSPSKACDSVGSLPVEIGVPNCGTHSPVGGGEQSYPSPAMGMRASGKQSNRPAGCPQQHQQSQRRNGCIPSFSRQRQFPQRSAGSHIGGSNFLQQQQQQRTPNVHGAPFPQGHGGGSPSTELYYYNGAAPPNGTAFHSVANDSEEAYRGHAEINPQSAPTSAEAHQAMAGTLSSSGVAMHASSSYSIEALPIAGPASVAPSIATTTIVMGSMPPPPQLTMMGGPVTGGYVMAVPASHIQPTGNPAVFIPASTVPGAAAPTGGTPAQAAISAQSPEDRLVTAASNITSDAGWVPQFGGQVANIAQVPVPAPSLPTVALAPPHIILVYPPPLVDVSVVGTPTSVTTPEKGDSCLTDGAVFPAISGATALSVATMTQATVSATAMR